jgi:hypothetical protein
LKISERLIEAIKTRKTDNTRQPARNLKSLKSLIMATQKDKIIAHNTLTQGFIL